jgi:SAM-dependent methyltransferase
MHEMKRLYEGQETKVNLLEHLSRRDHKCTQARVCLELVRRHRAHGRLLEVGSAAGYFLWEARKLGYDVQGLDITRQLVDFSRDVLGVPTVEGTLRGAPFAAGAFDLVYHRNVLSHLADPCEEFRIMHRLLAPGGLLVFETGNAAELPAAEAGELELPDHLFHFSEATIRELLERTGFHTVEIHRYALVTRFPAIQWLVRRFSTNRSEKPEATKALARLLPRSLPPTRPGARLASTLGQFLRYGVGACTPGQGRRCTLVVVGVRA